MVSTQSELLQFLEDSWDDAELVVMAYLEDLGNRENMKPNSMDIRLSSLLSPLAIYRAGARFTVSGHCEFDHNRVKAWVCIAIVSTIHSRVSYGEMFAVFAFTILTRTTICHGVD